MRLTIWDPFREMAALQRAVNSLARDVTTRGRTRYPSVELLDKGDSIVITAELPGVSKDKVDLTVLGDTLTIAGEKKVHPLNRFLGKISEEPIKGVGSAPYVLNRLDNEEGF